MTFPAGNLPYIPLTGRIMPPQGFEALISQVGQRVSWLRGHTCPCVYGGGGADGRLPQLGSAQRTCTRCFGVGVYWDTPSVPFRAYISFMHTAPTPDEPGVRTNEAFGLWQSAEPSLTIPYWNPTLPVGDPGQPTVAWQNASVEDQFVPVDMTARYTAVLQAGIKENLPFQQNLTVAPEGAVTVWDPASGDVVPVADYSVSGATVVIGGYPPGTNYMVEFLAAPKYVVFRAAGGLPHVRPFGGGTVNEPRRWRLQALDFWTRQRGIEQQAAGSARAGGMAKPYVPSVGRVVPGP